jgi:hypothetical protein
LRVAVQGLGDAVDVNQVDAQLVAAHRAAPTDRYSTVTDLARLRGWSTSVPRDTATS